MSDWYSSNRLLGLGAHGPDVKALQIALNDAGAQPRLVPDGYYGSNTARAVKDFQQRFKLIDDGQAGAVTQALLMDKGFRYAPATPRAVFQGNLHLCWAASLESVLTSSLGAAWRGRDRLTVNELRARFSGDLLAHDAINPASLRAIGKALRFNEKMVGKVVRIESILRDLRRHGPLLMVDNSTGSVMHTRVIFGVKVTADGADVLLMDPMAGFTELPVGEIRAMTVKGFFGPVETIGH